LAVPATVVAQPGVYMEKELELTVLVSENPFTDKVKTPVFILCNCWAYVKSKHSSLPGTNYILSHLSDHGSVAVFYYPKVDLHHYGIVLYEHDDYYVIEETNYTSCTKGLRNVPKDDPSLIGFFDV